MAIIFLDLPILGPCQFRPRVRVAWQENGGLMLERYFGSYRAAVRFRSRIKAGLLDSTAKGFVDEKIICPILPHPQRRVRGSPAGKPFPSSR